MCRVRCGGRACITKNMARRGTPDNSPAAAFIHSCQEHDMNACQCVQTTCFATRKPSDAGTKAGVAQPQDEAMKSARRGPSRARRVSRLLGARSTRAARLQQGVLCDADRRPRQDDGQLKALRVRAHRARFARDDDAVRRSFALQPRQRPQRLRKQPRLHATPCQGRGTQAGDVWPSRIHKAT